MGDYYENPNANNYTVGGIRMDFSQLLDETTDPWQYLGFISLGNIVEGPFAQDITELEHYTAKTGKRSRDRKVSTAITPQFTATLDELNVRNLQLLFRAELPEDVDAEADVAVSGETMRLDGEEIRCLKQGFNQDAVVVKSFDEITTYMVDDDYTVETFLSMPGSKTLIGIRRVDGGAISDGAVVKVSYECEVLAHKLLTPATKLEIKGQLRIAFVSDTGNEMWFRHDKSIVTPEGDFGFNSEDWSTCQLAVALEEDDDDPDHPYGRWEHYGVGSDF